ncbi:MAG: CinA family nicotinamide mononucleotide deamidase-related protein [Brevinematia bacterium]
MDISMLAIGNELLEKVIETNSHFLSDYLMKEGLELKRILIVRDKIDEIKSALQFLSDISDVILVSGGLGPTDDDLTREAFSEYTGEELFLDENVLGKIKSRFESRNIKFQDGNQKQALVIKNSIVFDNPVGTAPGLYYKKIDKEYFLFPGVPSEWREMIKLYLPNFIKEWQKNIELKKFSFIFHTYGISEAKLNQILREKLDKDNVSFGTIADEGIISFRIDILSRDKENAETSAKKIIEEDLGLLKDNILGFSQTEFIEESFVRKMIEKGKKLVVAESCTGGLLSKRITDVPGSSAMFFGGIVCYSNKLKETLLSVPHDILEKYGAVSEETVKFMDAGLMKLFPETDYRISISGIAGPDGGTEEKPVGTVYIAIGEKDGIFTQRLNFFGSRNDIRQKSINYCLSFLLKKL